MVPRTSTAKDVSQIKRPPALWILCKRSYNAIDRPFEEIPDHNILWSQTRSAVADYPISCSRTRAERSLSVTDVSKRFVFSSLYELPFGRGRKYGAGMSRLADFLVVGWQVNGIWTLSRGTPLILVNA